MTIRTSERRVSFKRPFVLGRWGEVLPAGDYSVETDEELLDCISFPAYRRIVTLIHLHAGPDSPGLTRTAVIDPRDLDAALSRDAAPETPVDRVPCQEMTEVSGRLQMEKADLTVEEQNVDERTLRASEKKMEPAVGLKPLAILRIIEVLTARRR